MPLLVARLLLFPVFAVARLFIALAMVTASPRQPRLAISEVLLVIGSTLTNGAWSAAWWLSRSAPQE